jgi:hypothetical protein
VNQSLVLCSVQSDVISWLLPILRYPEIFPDSWDKITKRLTDYPARIGSWTLRPNGSFPSALN